MQSEADQPLIEPTAEQSFEKQTLGTSTTNEGEEKDVAKPKKTVPKEKKKNWKDFFNVSEQSSHTKFYKKQKPSNEFQHVSRNDYLSISESMSGSSDTFNCVHGPEGKQYTQKGLLKRNILKNLDPIPTDRKWNDQCPPSYGWEIAEKLVFMVQSPTIAHQADRLQTHLWDFAKTSSNGYRIDTLKSFCTILDYLLESVPEIPALREGLIMLLKNLKKPIFLKAASDVVKYFNTIQHYMGFMGYKAEGVYSPTIAIFDRMLIEDCNQYHGYLLIKLDDDELFDMVSNAIIWHLSASDNLRGPGTVQLRHSLAAAGPALRQTAVRMIAVATSHRFPTFLEITLLLACDTVDNCIEMMKDNIIENIFYRFNPYFPERDLPSYDINPMDCQDVNVRLGDSSVNMTTVLSLLLVLVKTTKKYLDDNPSYRTLFPSPDCYAQRCFIWAYRYECRAREHRHERTTLTVIAAVLTKCFGDRLLLFSSILMQDVMSLSVLTELPPRNDWIGTVNFTTSQQDVQFKKILIYYVVDLLKVFPYNKFMIQSRYWLLGIMYLLDPGLCSLRARWSPAHFAELRKICLQALVCTIPYTDPKLVRQYGLIRRIMWYIEWYSEKPYEIPVLYWCMRLLQVAIYHRRNPERENAIQDLFDTHGIIILIHLCYTLMEQKLPPVERSQAVIALSLRLLTSAVISNKRVSCCVYPTIKWPVSVNFLARKMLDVVLFSLDKHYIVSDRWLISLLNFIWEAIVWKLEYREEFVVNDGVYKLLDIITMTQPPVQCIALALVCDTTRAGDAVGQLVSWRANLGASNANPNVVNRGATIASLLAAVFREGCRSSGVQLNEYGVLQDLDFPIMSVDARNELTNSDVRYTISHSTPVCLAAADLAGSCMSKAFAILHMLSEDLEHKVSLADEAYNLYKNIKLAIEDEVILVLCSHYLTLKLNEVWRETKVQNIQMYERDNRVLEDFVNVGKGWAKEVKRQQEDVIANYRKKEHEEERSLYTFLGRIRLNIALDALRAVRCVSRSTDHNRLTEAMINDAVFAHHRRDTFAETNESLLRTYKPPLDDQNITGQDVKVTSIHPKDLPKQQRISSATAN